VRVSVGVHGHAISYALAVVDRRCSERSGQRRSPQPPTPVVQEAAGVSRGSPGGRQGVDTWRQRRKHVSAAREGRRTDTQVRAGASAVVSAHRSSKGGGAHSALQSRLGPDHHYVDLLKRCKKILLFTPRTASRQRLIS